MRNDNATDNEKLEEELLDLVAEEGMIERDALSRDAQLAELDIASADFIMILMAIEEKYGIYISVDNEMADLKTVQDLLSVASRKILEQSEA
ncbi:phosphopantetheine-binding protein [Psychromarinibacter sp. C21-152]|uniref:Phosphopantetheine-binding protein n=1 Tax=Psychromarinibacter sediminicola TaxID=3033385 RepID=A0AAE3NV87_9RHOB|nr:phosphopantetheine-binding protein [Psychromarinibacter sediminicola]MDF0601590.1 phosphopantetheine-binding protein [Psychromarinibacter sediminicola]